jgi:hypothetical protein
LRARGNGIVGKVLDVAHREGVYHFLLEISQIRAMA